MAVVKFALVLSLAVLVLLPLCQPLEIPNYKGAEDWPKLAVGLGHQGIREGDRTGLHMRRLSGAITEPEPKPEPVPIIKPEPEPIPIIKPEPIDEPEPVPGLNPNPVITMPMPMLMPGSTASSAVRSPPSLSSVVRLFSLFVGWLC